MFHNPCQICACEFDDMEVKGHKSRLGVWWSLDQGERWWRMREWRWQQGLFFTTSPSSGLLSGAQQEYYTPCLLIHISHIPVWKKRGGRWKREAKTRRRSERNFIQTGGHQWQRKTGMLCMGTHDSIKRATNQAQNWNTLTDKQMIWCVSPRVLICVPTQSPYLGLYVQ